MESSTNLAENKMEISPAREELLKSVRDREELKTSWRRTFADVSLFHFKECDREANEINVDVQSLLQSAVLLFSVILLWSVLNQ